MDVGVSADWILAWRSEGLTTFFKFFPYLVSHYFYILIFAFVYWVRPQMQSMVHLGFLVPFSAILNCIVKLIFKIDRPPVDLHLLPVQDFGFPSGDVQVAVVFWGVLAVTISSRAVRVFGLAMVLGIMASRVYLGVHSILDVVAGAALGVGTVWIWIQPALQKVFNDSFYGKASHFWALWIGMLITYTLLSYHRTWPSVVVLSFSALAGYGLSLAEIGRRMEQGRVWSVKLGVISLLSLIGLVWMMQIVPSISWNAWAYYGSAIGKYVLAIVSLYIFIPKIQDRVLSYFK